METKLSEFSDVLVTRIAEAIDMPSAKIIDRIIIGFYAMQENLKDFLGDYTEAPEFHRFEPDDPEGWKIYQFVEDYYREIFKVLWGRRSENEEGERKDLPCKSKVERQH